jgi:hypothetical protein
LKFRLRDLFGELGNLEEVVVLEGETLDSLHLLHQQLQGLLILPYRAFLLCRVKRLRKTRISFDFQEINTSCFIMLSLQIFEGLPCVNCCIRWISAGLKKCIKNIEKYYIHSHGVCNINNYRLRI